MGRLVSPCGPGWPTANTRVWSAEIQDDPAAREMRSGACANANTRRTARQPQLPIPTTIGGFK